MFIFTLSRQKDDKPDIINGLKRAQGVWLTRTRKGTTTIHTARGTTAMRLGESAIAELWHRRAAELKGLRTEEDGPVTVVFPGTSNDDHGADVRDAVLATRRGLVIGDIEFHTSSSCWWEHRHHLDPAYNRVVLHVVGRRDIYRPAELENGRTVPTLNLELYLNDGSRAFAPDISACLPCGDLAHRKDKDAIFATLDKAGENRFEQKTTSVCREMENDGPRQTLYRLAMEALGYHRNRDPMKKLAAAASMERLNEAVPPGTGDDECTLVWQGVLLGTAGLLPSQRELRKGGPTAEHAQVNRMETAWSKQHTKPMLSENDWHFSRVRPGNYPVRRIAAASYLLARFLKNGPERLVSYLDRRPRELIRTLTVPAEGYWREHLDFGQPASRPAPALCGPGRAADIAVNAVLPFLAAYLEASGKSSRAVRDIYRAFPGLPENTILERMRSLTGIPEKPALPACLQQGLLHINRTWCEKGGCAECPFGGT